MGWSDSIYEKKNILNDDIIIVDNIYNKFYIIIKNHNNWLNKLNIDYKQYLNVNKGNFQIYKLECNIFYINIKPNDFLKFKITTKDIRLIENIDIQKKIII